LRLCRALIAAGFNRLGWVEVPDVGRRLLEALSREPPVFHLPPATAAHTRHYMPPFKGNTTKVLDAFAYVGRGVGDVVGIAWGVELSVDELALLDALLGSLTYLGRAESWIEAQRVDTLPEGLDRCAPSESAPGPGHERVPLLGALAPEAYAAWREEAIAREKERRFGGKGAEAGKKSKGSGAKGLTKRALADIEALFPADIVAALCAETPALQKQGWNQPPGTRWLSYWRRDDALTTLPAKRRAAFAKPAAADTALFALTSNTAGKEVLPPLTDAIRRLESLHDALVGLSSDAAGGRGPSPCFTARMADGKPIEGHRHATLVPLSLERRAGRLDHVLVHAPMGFEPHAASALRRLRRSWAKGLPDIYVTLVGLGMRDDFVTAVPQLGESRIWRSVTPFVPPRFLKQRGSSSLEGQVQAELASRGLPAAVRVEVELERDGYAPAEHFWSLWSEGAPLVRIAETDVGGAHSGPMAMLSRKWRHFRRERKDPARRPPVAAAVGLRLAFEVALRGPIALGYASHFGLGQFVPEDGSTA
jgi:CRISPR-associated protein Csb2